MTAVSKRDGRYMLSGKEDLSLLWTTFGNPIYKLLCQYALLKSPAPLFVKTNYLVAILSFWCVNYLIAHYCELRVSSWRLNAFSGPAAIAPRRNSQEFCPKNDSPRFSVACAPPFFLQISSDQSDALAASLRAQPSRELIGPLTIFCCPRNVFE